MFLVNDKSEADSCEDSKLWEYVLTVLIISFISRNGGGKSAANSSDNTGMLVCVCIFCAFIELGLATWGGIELYVNSCSACDLGQQNVALNGTVTVPSSATEFQLKFDGVSSGDVVYLIFDNVNLTLRKCFSTLQEDVITKLTWNLIT